MKTLLKSQHLFNSRFYFPFSFFFSFLSFLKAKGVPEIHIPANQRSKPCCLTCCYKNALVSTSSQRIQPHLTHPWLGLLLNYRNALWAWLREYRDQESYCLISDYLISMSIAGATGQNSLTCFRSPNKTLSDIY